jgi:hypothetical protein
MTTIDSITTWLQDVLKTSNSYSNSFYYDGRGIIRNYEKTIEHRKKVIRIIESKQETLKQIHKNRLKEPSIFTSLYNDINRLELQNLELELRIAKQDLDHGDETLIILKNLVALSKITNNLMQELPVNERTQKLIRDFRRFQIIAEPVLDDLRTHLDKKCGKHHKDDFKHR